MRVWGVFGGNRKRKKIIVKIKIKKIIIINKDLVKSKLIKKYKIIIKNNKYRK